MRSGTGERIGHVGRPVHQRFSILVAAKGFKDLAGGYCSSHAECSASERLAEAHDVGNHIRLFTGKHRTGATKTGRNLIGDQQQTLLFRDASHGSQCGR